MIPTRSNVPNKFNSRSIELINPKPDPDISAIVDDIVKEFKASVLRVSRGFKTPQGASFERSFTLLANQRFASNRKIKSRILAMAKNKATLERNIGRYSRVNLTSPSSITRLKPSNELIQKYVNITNKLKKDPMYFISTSLKAQGYKLETPEKMAYCNNYLTLKIDQIKCVEETGWDWTGSDEIDVGGSAINPIGATTKITAWSAGSFDSGSVKKYRPNKTMANFDLRAGGDSWPKSFLVTLAMAEIDGRGFDGFLKKLFEALEEKIKSKLKELAQAAGAAIGTALGGIAGTGIGALIGWIAGYVIDKIVDWVKSLFDDDIIGVENFRFVQPGPCALIEGTQTQSFNLRRFKGSGGIYDVRYCWQLS